MTKPLDISPDVLERTRRLTHAASDEEAIVRALDAFNARGEELERPAVPDDFEPQCQADLVRYFGTFKDFITVEELHAMREMD